MGRAVLAVLACAACGRIGFDPVEDPGLPPIPLVLPEGGAFDSLAVGPDGAWYVGAVNVGFWRSDDHQTWTPCAAATGDDITVSEVSGEVYVSGTDVRVSTDRCASWQPTSIDRTAFAVGVQGAFTFGLVGNGLRQRVANMWATVPTPSDGTPFVSFEATAQRRLIGTQGSGLLVHNAGGFTAITAGLDTLDVGAIAIAPTRMYAITKATATGTGAISCSDGTGLVWTICANQGGIAIAVDPTDPLHVIASPYDQLGQTTNAFASFTSDKQQFAMDAANVRKLKFTAAGEILAASNRGVFYAPDRNLAWEARVTGLSSWNVHGIFVDGDDTLITTNAGVLRSNAGAPFTLSTKGMVLSTFGTKLAIGPDGSIIFAGRQVWRSVDRGDTWAASFSLDQTDDYVARTAVFSGARLYVGTGTRVLAADPPYATFSRHSVGGMDRDVNALLAIDGSLWAGTPDGLWVSTDNAATFTRVTPITTPCLALFALPDGGIAAGTTDKIWISDPTRADWKSVDTGGDDVLDFAVVPTGLAAATNHGALLSTDRGVTWTEIPATASYNVRSLVYDAASSELVLGVVGAGLVRVAL